MKFSIRLVSLFSVGALCVVLGASAVAAAANNPIPQVVGPPVPQAVAPGSKAFTLKVYGANFVQGAVVNWNRSPRTTTFVSARELDAQIPASDVAKATAGYITVTNPKPGGGLSSSSYALVEVHKSTKAMNVEVAGFYTFNGADPSYAIVGDVTGDGILDLVTGVGTQQVALNIGNGDGTFHLAVYVGKNYDTVAGATYGDFNGDGRIDLIYGWLSTNDDAALEVILNQGHGRFHALPVFDRENCAAETMVAGDFNGDGIVDLAVRTLGCGARIYLGRGDGTFRLLQRLNSLQLGGEMVAADFNGDGILDLVIADGGDGVPNNLYLLIGNGDGTFQKPRSILADKYQLLAGEGNLQVTDFNGDGIPDLAFWDYHYNQGTVFRNGILLGKGGGTFQRANYFDGGTFATGDFNSDGKTDLVISSLDQNNNPAIYVRWGNGDGTFQKPKKVPVSQDYDGGLPLPGDFNSDGLLDFSLFSPLGDRVYIQK